jgi:polysaccharide biosynthesis/export protein
MAGVPSVAVLRDIQTLFDTGTASGLSDRQLLERFVSGRDEPAEAAFQVLVQRHGPMVLRVCHNVLRDSTDAQDAFQATFLILVKRNGSIRRLESVGSWLYGVACRVAARARVEAARRRAAERRGALRVVQAVDPSDGAEHNRAEFGPMIQEEVRRLPEKYRAVVTLCYWQGLTQEQAAVQLGCPLGTVRSRLARARGKLHTRLTRRGLAPLAGVVAAALGSRAAGAARLGMVPNNLVNSTMKASAQVAAGRAMNDVASTSVAVLIQHVVRSMFMMKIKMVAVTLLLAGLGAYGAILAAPQADSGKAAPSTRRGSNLTAKKANSKAQPTFVNLENYVVEPPDVILVEVLEALPGRPISGERLVRPDGKISLGFYGDIYVAGLTLAEVKEKVVRHLQKYLDDHALGVVELDKTGEPITDPETKKLRAIDPKDSNMVFVDIAKANSKNYYVQGDVLVAGRLPITGKETVLDAINIAGGLGPNADHKGVVLYRPGRKREPPLAIHIDIDQIIMGDDASTNYQLQPGDRLVVPRNPSQNLGAPKSVGSQPDDSHAERFEDRAPLLRLEQRLTDVERKLDLILEAIKPRTP